MTKKPPITTYGWMYYLLDVNPEPWKVGPLSIRRGNGRGMYPAIGRDQQLHSYQMAIREQLEDYDTIKMPDKFAARYYFWRRRDRYTNDKQRTVRKHEVDLTNVLKATEDACQGILFDNDVDCVAHENYFLEQGSDVPFGRVVIGVSPVQDRPVVSQVMDPGLYQALLRKE